MIKVDRIACPASLDPSDTTAAGPKELAKITTKMVAGEKVLSKDFSAYASLEVRDALREMFHGKCAYCEGDVAATQDTDIEHYRPKKGVTEADKAGVAHGGYWWLAMVWENLVLSCQHCNQSRTKQVIIPEGATVEEIKAILVDPEHSKSGKANSFPTEDGIWVTNPTDDISTEKPLIINPVDTNPEEHLEWVLLNGGATVRAKNGSRAGEASWKILGLNRRWLEENRRILLLEMQQERNEIIEGMNGWLTEPEPMRTVWARMADIGIERLLRRCEPNKPFAALARAYLATVQAEINEMTEGLT
ncbi:MAG: HNH endonuclease [Alphaproteobacteria bacterium]